MATTSSFCQPFVVVRWNRLSPLILPSSSSALCRRRGRCRRETVCLCLCVCVCSCVCAMQRYAVRKMPSAVHAILHYHYHGSFRDFVSKQTKVIRITKTFTVWSVYTYICCTYILHYIQRLCDMYILKAGKHDGCHNVCWFVPVWSCGYTRFQLTCGPCYVVRY